MRKTVFEFISCFSMLNQACLSHGGYHLQQKRGGVKKNAGAQPRHQIIYCVNRLLACSDKGALSDPAADRIGLTVGISIEESFFRIGKPC